MSEVYDVIVVGAGVEGSATAYQLSRRGVKNVLLLEQFDALHPRGSSHGYSRMTRRSYTQPYYVHMMDEAYKLWEEIEQKSGTKLYICTGLLAFGYHDCKEMDMLASSLSTLGVEYEVFSGAEANRRFPEQLKLPSDYKCVLEKDAGILLANKAMAAMQRQFKEGGGVLLEHHKVTSIQPGAEVTVVTNRGVFRTRKLIVTAGPWAPALLKHIGLELPFKAIQTEVHYWKVEKPDVFSSDNFPSFGAFTIPRTELVLVDFYGTPVYEYPGLIKICHYTGPDVDPDHRNIDPMPLLTEMVSQFIQQHFKGISSTPSICDSCIFSESPDDNPVMDVHPLHNNIIIGAGFSHGFRLSPVVGKILSELALDLPPSYDLTPFRVDRFS